MKTYVLTVSRQFPKTHKRAGDQTYFPEMILSALGKHELLTDKCFSKPPEKLHTIRANYGLWKKRENEINEGMAILSIRYWSEKPYRSKQIEICQLDKIGVQRLDRPANFIFAEINSKMYDWEYVAKNDGLSFEDFCEWFKNYDLSEPMAIIQFTDFRY